MTMREKIRASIAHRNVDFVPINVETTAGFEKNLAAVVGEKNVDAALGNHMLRKKYKRNKKLENGDELDLFGVTWQTSKDGGDASRRIHWNIVNWKIMRFLRSAKIWRNRRSPRWKRKRSAIPCFPSHWAFSSAHGASAVWKICCAT